MIKHLILFLFSILLTTTVLSQHTEIHHDLEPDSLHHISSIREIFLKGHTEGHIRNHFMTTINEGDLYDYWANAIGGSLGYHTGIWKGFQIGVKGIFTFNLASSNLNKIDPLSGKSAKWEKELFDVTRPHETKDLDRLEELYLKYYYKKSFATFGKIDINKGPLLLKRDGRMKPFVYKGAWVEFNEFKNQKLTIGWLYAVSPRGMTEWYDMNEAIGLTNNGYLPNGNYAHYHEYSNTKGLAVFGYENKIKEKLKFQFWNYYLHHMYNISWTQIDYSTKSWFTGIQYVHQFADPYQKTLNYNNRVYQPNEKANVVSAQLGYKSTKGKFKISIAYLHGFNTGRFIFPSELTRDNFYVSQPRSWINGFGNVDVYMIRAHYSAIKKKWKGLSADLRLSNVSVPSNSDYSQNSFGKSSYFQSTFIGKYSFQNKLKGLHIALLYVIKYSNDSSVLSPSQKFYNTNLHHFNFMMNIHF